MPRNSRNRMKIYKSGFYHGRRANVALSRLRTMRSTDFFHLEDQPYHLIRP